MNESLARTSFVFTRVFPGIKRKPNLCLGAWWASLPNRAAPNASNPPSKSFFNHKITIAAGQWRATENVVSIGILRPPCFCCLCIVSFKAPVARLSWFANKLLL